MCFQNNRDPIFEVLKIAIPSLLVIAGWGIVYYLQHKMAHKLQTRKDIRDNLGFLKALIKGFKEHCVSYHTKTDSNVLGLTITSELNEISQDVQRLIKALPIQSEGIIAILAEVSMDATGGDFETKGRRRKELTDAKLNRLMGQLNLLICKLENAYWEKFSD